jgi:hypothetical protein
MLDTRRVHSNVSQAMSPTRTFRKILILNHMVVAWLVGEAGLEPTKASASRLKPAWRGGLIRALHRLL